MAIDADGKKAAGRTDLGSPAPVLMPSTPVIQPRSPEAAARAARAKLLMVDDSPANLLALESILEPLGHTLIRAYSGEEALRLLLREEYALVLMDVRMPGVDGLQA